MSAIGARVESTSSHWLSLVSLGAANADADEEEVLDVLVESFRTEQSFQFSVYPQDRRYGS